ncbi:MAG: transcription-repair coupling factor [Chromatiales bacterium]|nr:transcription-repair coupling factor [Gammaproteobacteria bacterium]MCP5352648.1 transcription-repair coupling factor [Chromatiales bacterium]
MTPQSPLNPTLPDKIKRALRWGRLYGSAPALALVSAARTHAAPVVVITADNRAADRYLQELAVYGADLDVLGFPDWETLPYDVFSPLPEIVSQRLTTLHRLPDMQRGVLVVPIATLMQRIPPRTHLEGNTFLIDVGSRLDPDETRKRLEAAGYRCVEQVFEHGEFAVRGSLLDLFPMGGGHAYRIDLFDDEVETIRTFDPETQLSTGQVERIALLPAREFPLDKDAIARFRRNFRQRFEIGGNDSPLFRDVSDGNAPGGIEYYLPLFYEQLSTLFDFLPDDALFVTTEGVAEAAAAFWSETGTRYHERTWDRERPPLRPDELYLDPDDTVAAIERRARIDLQAFEVPEEGPKVVNFATTTLPPLQLNARLEHPAEALKRFIDGFGGRVLFAAETAGRREALLDLLRDQDIRPKAVEDWAAFVAGKDKLAITVAPVETGMVLEQPRLAVIAEAALYGEKNRQGKRKTRSKRDPDAIVRDLTELQEGSPVVHEDQGIGRYLGLRRLTVGGIETEFLTLEYAGGDKLYVPVSSLHLISRYSGADPEHAPLHKMGGEQWQRIKKKAAEKLRDVAAELLEIYARREAKPGTALVLDEHDYRAFAAAFPFEETPDQQTAIDAVLADLQSKQPMDRVVCGDVGFGKTEVAMRAAFAVASAGRQVALLVPTTLLAQQHFQNFQDRFADTALRIEMLSRFTAGKETTKTLNAIREGGVDIVIGTHKLLSDQIKFKDLGLVIVDEEQRFGVRQKEHMKKLRAEVDMLTLTATPIPRTLNMSLSGLRDLSIIATPPAARHAIKTFVNEWNNTLIREALLREIKRGGQVYFLHNKVEDIDKTAREIAELVPEASVRVAHGQMREKELEQVMLDFYHRRFNVLVSTTIIESGIDQPNANTIVINRADKLGLAQLHQLRGRVGRSHHRAYAYLITPPKGAMTPDAVKRLQAIESMEDLGAGFTLATHDLEIRGAGELLGEGQSGQIQEIGYTLYTELLERTVRALKSGQDPNLAMDSGAHHGAEVDLRMPALIPEDFIPDVHTRLVMYKRIANAPDQAALRELQVEMIDRFGLLPDATKNLFRTTELKLAATRIGITKVEAGDAGGRLLFGKDAKLDVAELLKLIQTQPRVFKLDGQEKLRFAMPLPDPGERIDTVAELLARLTPPELA